MIDMSKRPVGPLSEVVAQHVATFLKPVFFFATECGDHIHFVNADDGAVAFSRRLGNECITTLALSSCRQHLAGICGDGWLWILDVKTGATSHSEFFEKLANEKAESLAYAPHGHAFAVGCDDGNLMIIDTISWEAIFNIQLGNTAVSHIAYAPSGQHIAAACGCIVCIIHTETWVIAHTRVGADLEEVMSLTYRPGGQDLAIVNLRMSLEVLNMRTFVARSVESRVDINIDTSYACAYRPDGQQLALVSQDVTGRLSVFDAESLDIVYSTGIGFGICDVISVAYTACGQQLAVGADDSNLRVIDAESGAVIHVVRLDTSLTNVVQSIDCSLGNSLTNVVWAIHCVQSIL